MDLTSLYHTAIEQTYDDDHALIVDTFKQLLNRGKNEVRLINYYYGMPLLFPAKIVSLDRAALDMDIHSQQAVAISQDHFTFIRCDAFKRDIGAHVQYVNVRKHAATLNKFFFVEIMAERRSALRLALEPPSELVIRMQDEKLFGRVLDISTGGLAARLERTPGAGDGFEATIQFMLPNLLDGSTTAAVTPARHIGTLEREGGQIAKFAIAPDKQLERQISQYLFQRQVEIIRELKEAAI